MRAHRSVIRTGAWAAMAALVLAGCGQGLKKENEQLKTQLQDMSAISAEKDSLLRTVVENTQLMNDINAELSKVKNLRTGVMPVTSPESGQVDTVRVKDYLMARVQEVTERVNEAETRLAASQRRVRNLSRQVDTLKTGMADFQQTLVRYQAIIDTQKVMIASMTDQINQLQETNTQLVAQRAALIDTVGTLVSERNTIYYTVGRKRDLIDRGVAVEEGSKFLFFGGKSLQPARNLDVSEFSTADLRSTTSIPLPDSTREYKIISRQNLDGLAVAADKGKVRGSIEIANPDLFWGPSHYLIVVEQ